MTLPTVRSNPSYADRIIWRRVWEAWQGVRAAEEHFTRAVRHGEAPDEVPEHPLPAGDPVHLPALLADAFGLSTSEARRLIAQHGVKLDGEVVGDLDLPRGRLAGQVLQAGKRRFVRLNEAT